MSAPSSKPSMLKVRLVRSRGSAQGRTGPIGRGGRMLGRGRGIFRRDAGARRHLPVRRRGAALRGDGRRTRSTSRARNRDDPKIPSYAGGKFPLSTYLAARVRNILADPAQWKALPQPVREWLEIQKWRSLLPGPRELLVETFPRADKHYLVCYPFEGRLAHQTLGMLLTRRLERARLRPLGFVANEYALAVWGLGDVGAAASSAGSCRSRELFDEDMLGDDLEAWLAESALMKRTFRNNAIIAGLIERRSHRRGEDPPAGHDLDRPHLRRIAQAPARSSAAAGGACRCCNRSARYQAARRNALPHQGSNHP